MTHLPNLITDLALILASAAVVTLIFKKLKQPLVLGYIIAGFLVGPNFHLFPTITDVDSIKIWAEIGVIFLLFSLGLEFSFKKLLKVGGAASITAAFDIGLMFALGYLTGNLLGWSTMTSIFLGGILSISSTTIIFRAFDELGLKSHKFAQLVFGVLIIEDLVAIILLVLLSTLAISQQFQGIEILISLLKLSFFLALWFLGGIFLIPTLLRSMRKLMNDEMMLIVSLALCLIMVLLAVEAGFSAALGAFIMGSILAETTYAEKIEDLVKSVKDLFGAIFFVSVGMLIAPVMLAEYAGPILIITFVTIFGKIIGPTVGALVSGQPLKHSLRTGMSLAQIGEFSFIIATLGVTLKVTDDFFYPVAVAVSAITAFTTPYLMRLSDPLYRWLEKILPVRWKRLLTGYRPGSITLKTGSVWKTLLKAYMLTIVINCVILTSLILLSLRFLLPFINSKFENLFLSSLITAVVSLSLMAPFLWGLAGKKIKSIAYYDLWNNRSINRGPLILLELLRVSIAVIFIFYFLNRIFPEILLLLSAFAIIIILGFVFSGKLKFFYNRIEKRFLLNLNEREEGNTQDHVAELLPWDTHIAEFEVHPESELAGKKLSELELREKFGINIARIERGRMKINVPSRDERLFPYDNIFVIGTDDELEKFRNQYLIAATDLNDGDNYNDVTLHQFIVNKNSPLLGKTIHQTGIHENMQGLVIGIERGGDRILNPESTERFQPGDHVWIAGEYNILLKLAKEKDDLKNKAEFT